MRVRILDHTKLLAVGITAFLCAVLCPIPSPGRAAESQNQVPEEARRQLQEALGSPFAVFRAKVQDELKLSANQEQKFDDELQTRVQEAMEFFQKLEGRAPKDREKALKEYRPKAHMKLATFLKATLKADQLKRLRQIELRLEGAFALGQPDVGKELKITDEQRMRFMAVVQDLQKKIEPLIKEAHSGGNPEEIRPKVMHIRKEHEAKIEAILTDAQKKQWNEMLGERFTLDD
jgi:hypothetical protein